MDLIGSNDVRVSEHGYDDLAEDDIAVQDILDVAQRGTVIEDYPSYPKGPSVLVLQFDGDIKTATALSRVFTLQPVAASQ